MSAIYGCEDGFISESSETRRCNAWTNYKFLVLKHAVRIGTTVLSRVMPQILHKTLDFLYIPE
jgi:hypothetical protein